MLSNRINVSGASAASLGATLTAFFFYFNGDIDQATFWVIGSAVCALLSISATLKELLERQ